MDSLDFIMMVENGEFDHDNQEHLNALQEMIDSGLVYQLQGSWGRFANQMIKLGLVTAKVKKKAG